MSSAFKNAKESLSHFENFKRGKAKIFISLGGSIEIHPEYCLNVDGDLSRNRQTVKPKEFFINKFCNTLNINALFKTGSFYGKIDSVFFGVQKMEMTTFHHTHRFDPTVVGKLGKIEIFGKKEFNPIRVNDVDTFNLMFRMDFNTGVEGLCLNK